MRARREEGSLYGGPQLSQFLRRPGGASAVENATSQSPRRRTQPSPTSSRGQQLSWVRLKPWSSAQFTCTEWHHGPLVVGAAHSIEAGSCFGEKWGRSWNAERNHSWPAVRELKGELGLAVHSHPDGIWHVFTPAAVTEDWEGRILGLKRVGELIRNGQGQLDAFIPLFR